MDCKVLITPGPEWKLERKVLQIFPQSPPMPFTLVSQSSTEFVTPFKIVMEFESDMEHGPIFNKHLLGPNFVP